MPTILDNIAKSDKYSRLEDAIYAAAWVVIFSLPLLSEAYEVWSGRADVFEWRAILHAIRNIAPFLLLFLLNNWCLLPHLFWKKRKACYFAVLACLFALMWSIQTPPAHPHFDPTTMPPEFEIPRPHHGPLDMFHITNLIIEICIISANFGIKLYIQSIRRENQLLNMRNEKMTQELQSLKYQISPHFLMNTLNNIQSLIESNPATAARTVQQLSHLMRYLLYDNNSHDVPLRQEIQFMHNFIALMRLRYPDSVRISTNLPDDDEGLRIPPLLFISFIENAFKYGVSYTSDSEINISLTILPDHLLFRCSNIISQEAAQTRHGSGIGIQNVRRRLDLIYADDYSLQITQPDNHFLVELKLKKK